MAFARLCEDYWAPLYRFVRQRGYSRADAEDLTRVFLLICWRNRLMEAGPEQRAIPHFSPRACFKRYLSAARAHRSRDKSAVATGRWFISTAPSLTHSIKRRLEALSIRGASGRGAAFEWNWAAALVSRAWRNFDAEYSSGPKSRLLAELRPFLTGGVGLPSHEAAATRLAFRWRHCAVTSFVCAHVIARCSVRRSCGQCRGKRHGRRVALPL